MLLALLLAVLIGLSLGLLGSGGAIVTLPVLVYVAGVPPPEAVAMSLAIVGGTSLVGAVVQFRRGHFHRSAAILFTATGVVFAYLGSGLTHLVSARILMLLFSGLMLIVGFTMVRSRSSARPDSKCSPPRCLAIGALVGVLTGFLGVGGGFSIVPALVLFAGIPARQAFGTSLAIISFNSLSGVIGQLRHLELDWIPTLMFLAIALIGMMIGLKLADRVSERVLRVSFGGFVVVVGLALGIANLIR